MDLNDPKNGKKNNQLTVIHILLRNYYVYINIYVVGQGVQQNDKLGQEISKPPLTWSRKSVPLPPPTYSDVGAALTIYNTMCGLLQLSDKAINDNLHCFA